MHNQGGLKLLFIVNPISGGKEKNDWEASIREHLKDKPHEPQFYLLTGENDSQSVKHHIESYSPDRVIAVGGDGTVKMLSEILMEKDIPLGIIPAGSANGMATELGIPKEPKEAVDVVTDGVPKKIDVIRINDDQISIHLSDIGLNAMLVRYFEHSKKRGMWGYGKAIVRVMWEKQKMRVRFKTDTEEVTREAYMVVLANARKYGTGANINPEGNVSDGKFEVVVVRKLNVFEMVKAAFTEKPFDPGRIETFSTTSLELTTQRKAFFQVDGEYLGRITRITAKVLPQIVTVMLPRES
jgi:YegS/Rv2252/BmrU family lipid kinase